MVKRRAGFTLVEVLVALTLLSVGALALAASGTLAAGLVRVAEREAAAGRLAATLLDSLVTAPTLASGEVAIAGLAAEWIAGAAGDISLSVRYLDGSAARVLAFEAVSLLPLQSLPRRSGEAP